MQLNNDVSDIFDSGDEIAFSLWNDPMGDYWRVGGLFRKQHFRGGSLFECGGLRIELGLGIYLHFIFVLPTLNAHMIAYALLCYLDNVYNLEIYLKLS